MKAALEHTWLSQPTISSYGAGLAAMALALGHLRPEASVPLYLASAFLFLCCATDTFLGEIPNPLNLALVLLGLAWQVAMAGPGGLAMGLLGMLVGAGLLAIPYVLGGTGAGDVKALAALGALLGPGAIFQVFIYAGLSGGLLAILSLIEADGAAVGWGWRLRLFFRTGDWRLLQPEKGAGKRRFPYAAALAFGYFAFVSWGGLL